MASLEESTSNENPEKTSNEDGESPPSPPRTTGGKLLRGYRPPGDATMNSSAANDGEIAETPQMRGARTRAARRLAVEAAVAAAAASSAAAAATASTAASIAAEVAIAVNATGSASASNASNAAFTSAYNSPTIPTGVMPGASVAAASAEDGHRKNASVVSCIIRGIALNEHKESFVSKINADLSLL
jgi:hypothetical protein